MIFLFLICSSACFWSCTIGASFTSSDKPKVQKEDLKLKDITVPEVELVVVVFLIEVIVMMVVKLVVLMELWRV